MIQQLLAVNWLYDNQQYYAHPNGLGTARDAFFSAYNILTGEQKRTTSCGRCIAGMRLKLQQIKQQYDSMKKYPVYRTEKGNLSLVQQGTPSIFLVRASSDDKAKEMLQVLKAFEKAESKKIDDIKL